MDDLTKILLTSSLTVLGGVAVFVVGQLLAKFVIEPIHEFKKLLGEIRFGLVFHMQAIVTPVGDKASEDEASTALRKLACDLLSMSGAIPFYGFWSAAFCDFVPRPEQVNAAFSQLIGLSNSVHQPDRSEKNYARMAKIEQLLNFKLIDE